MMGLFKRKNIITSAIVESSPPAIFPANYEAFAKEYGFNPYVYACVRKIASAVAGVNWLVYSKDKTKELSGTRLNKLIERPNEFQGTSSFFDEMTSYLELTGNVFLFYNGKELYNMRPDRVVIVPGKAQNEVARYEYLVNGKKIMLKPDEVIHIKLFSPLDDWRGMTPLASSRLSASQNDAGREWNYTLLKNSAKPSGVLKTSGNLTENQFETLRRKISESYSGKKNSGRPLLLEGGLEWQQLGFNPSEMEWLNGLKLSAKEIAISFGVPPELIGDSSNKTYSNYQEARKAFYTETILPLLELLKSELNIKLGFNEMLDYDRDSIEALREDRKLVWTQAIEAVQAGILTQNEARELLGYEDIKGGDSLLVSAGMLTQATKEVKSNERELKWQSMERRRNAWVRSANEVMQKYFKEEHKEVVKYLQEGRNMETLIEKRKPTLERVLRAIYYASGEEFARESYNQVKSETTRETKEFSLWKAYMENWLTKEAGKKIKEISTTTLNLIRKELDEAVQNGETVPQMVKRLDKLYLENIIPHRSLVIARTEVISASNLANRAGALATGLELKKEWISTMDKRVRPGHKMADGQVKGMNEPYIVEGEQLMFPGDTSLGASGNNTIMCRCTEGYHAR